MPLFDVRPARRLLSLGCGVALVAACGGESTSPGAPDFTTLGALQLGSLDSSVKAMVDSNPTNPDLKSLLDSTVLVLAAGVPVARLELNTNLTTAPLHFVGIHRAYQNAGQSSFSTWTLIGFDDPAHLTSLVEVSGFNIAAGGTAPSSVSGTIGDGSGSVNALFLQVTPGGAVSEWYATSGTVSFASDSGATAIRCPGTDSIQSIATVTCTIETMRVSFTANAPSGNHGESARQASLPTVAGAPTMKFTYQF